MYAAYRLTADMALLTTVASSTGLLLKTMGFSVTAIKIDPYLNLGKGHSQATATLLTRKPDAGTMAPTGKAT